MSHFAPSECDDEGMRIQKNESLDIVGRRRFHVRWAGQVKWAGQAYKKTIFIFLHVNDSKIIIQQTVQVKFVESLPQYHFMYCDFFS